VDKMRLPAVVRLSRSFWDDARNGTAAKKRQFVMRQLTVVTAVTAVNTIELPRCEMKGLARVLAQCAALAHLNLRKKIFFLFCFSARPTSRSQLPSVKCVYAVDYKSMIGGFRTLLVMNSVFPLLIPLRYLSHV